MKSITMPLAISLLLLGTVLLASPASATHPYTSTYCNGMLYNPLNGDRVVEGCNTYTTDGNGCSSTRYYYKIAGAYVYTYTYHNCNGETYYCYANVLYVDTSPVRTGVCGGRSIEAELL